MIEFDLARFGEIIYNPRNTPAVGVIFILAPNMEDFPRADSGNDRTRIPLCAFSARAFARQLWRSDGTG
jgi:aconitate hydratase